jgi:protein SCO1/2
MIINLVVVSALGLVALAAYLISEQKETERARAREDRLLAAPGGDHASRDIGPGIDLGIRAPEFRLEKAGGGELSLQDLRGKVWVAEFIFTNCAGVCPQMSEMTSKLQDRTADLEDFRIVSFSVDPERDTLTKLEEYGVHYGADPGRWFFLRGPEEEISRIGNVGFKMLADEDILTHSPKCALVDREGRVRGLYDGAGPERVADFERLEKDIRALLAEGE